jgi:hypothetical protein
MRFAMSGFSNLRITVGIFLLCVPSSSLFPKLGKAETPPDPPTIKIPGVDREIDVDRSDTKVTDAGLKELKKALPKCSIY